MRPLNQYVLTMTMEDSSADTLIVPTPFGGKIVWMAAAWAQDTTGDTRTLTVGTELGNFTAAAALGLAGNGGTGGGAGITVVDESILSNQPNNRLVSNGQLTVTGAGTGTIGCMVTLTFVIETNDAAYDPGRFLICTSPGDGNLAQAARGGFGAPFDCLITRGWAAVGGDPGADYQVICSAGVGTTNDVAFEFDMVNGSTATVVGRTTSSSAALGGRVITAGETLLVSNNTPRALNPVQVAVVLEVQPVGGWSYPANYVPLAIRHDGIEDLGDASCGAVAIPYNGRIEHITAKVAKGAAIDTQLDFEINGAAAFLQKQTGTVDRAVSLNEFGIRQTVYKGDYVRVESDGADSNTDNHLLGLLWLNV